MSSSRPMWTGLSLTMARPLVWSFDRALTSSPTQIKHSGLSVQGSRLSFLPVRLGRRRFWRDLVLASPRSSHAPEFRLSPPCRAWVRTTW